MTDQMLLKKPFQNIMSSRNRSIKFFTKQNEIALLSKRDTVLRGKAFVLMYNLYVQIPKLYSESHRPSIEFSMRFFRMNEKMQTFSDRNHGIHSYRQIPGDIFNRHETL